MNTAAKLVHQDSTVSQPRLRQRVKATKPAEVRELYGFKILGDKVQGYFVLGTAAGGEGLEPVGPLPNEGQANKVIANLREYFPDEQYRVDLREVEFKGQFELGQQHQSAMLRVRGRLNAAYAERHGLFRVIDGWTYAYYVKLKSVGLVFERVGGDDDLPIHVTHGIDPTKSDKATPVGVIGPFEHEEEAEVALLAIAKLFPEESFDIHCSQIASSICLPMKLPKEQEVARQKVTALSARWRHLGGFVNYYTLDDAIQRAPFGKFGPFPTLKAMRTAEKAIKAHHPGALVVRCQRGLDEDMASASHADLCIEYTKTLEKLAALGA
ncbi:hypothetical protein [Phytopseudomonas daroniae]|uniref:hypothetical protein n=1 Tax=Phytopseudomonas daroniae TaxID=2487519 RepID=UPI001038309F|nr:hypothetical protein [Pseudomonas daroniae]TBU71253.1 hypothetical protein DNK10_24850 [Pseudomonas daroniae]